MNAPEIRSIAEAEGFSACLFLPGKILLLWCYQPWDSPADAYFYASNLSYRAAKRLAGGIGGALDSKTPLKPLCLTLPGFCQGKNTLDYYGDFGSRFCMQLIECAQIEKDDNPAVPPPPACGDCELCLRACPTGAITASGFAREKCLREHMLSGRETPFALREKMGEKILGCDLCQRVCPKNRPIARAVPPKEWENAFSLPRLLPPDEETLLLIEDMIGKNYASKNRLCAQALLCAGNARDQSLAPPVSALCSSPSSAVSAHAQWAKGRISEKIGKICEISAE